MSTTLTNLTARHIVYTGEINGKPSETIPDQAISAPELLRRFATGQPLGFKNVTPVYDEDQIYDVPEFYKMSKLDRLHIMQKNSEKVKELQDELKAFQKAEQIKQNDLKDQQQKETVLAKSDDANKDAKRSAKDVTS